jgi:hypothetical protein
MSKMICPDEANVPAPEQESTNTVSAAHSAVLARLIEEVRNENAQSPHAYNRMHNRHNRSR